MGKVKKFKRFKCFERKGDESMVCVTIPKKIMPQIIDALSNERKVEIETEQYIIRFVED